MLVSAVVAAVIMTSCTQSAENIADIIRMKKWSATLQSGSSAELFFKDDTAVFRIKSFDKKADVRLRGLGTIDSKRILIFNKSDGQPYFFDYSLKNNRLKLGYNGGNITLNGN